MPSGWQAPGTTVARYLRAVGGAAVRARGRECRVHTVSVAALHVTVSDNPNVTTRWQGQIGMHMMMQSKSRDRECEESHAGSKVAGFPATGDRWQKAV